MQRRQQLQKVARDVTKFVDSSCVKCKVKPVDPNSIDASPENSVDSIGESVHFVSICRRCLGLSFALRACQQANKVAASVSPYLLEFELARIDCLTLSLVN